MDLSSIAVQQREKEAKSLNSFLAFSLVGSLALHIGLLASGIGNLLSRTPELTEEPLEVVIVDPPKVEQVKPQPEPQQQQPQPSTAAVVSPGSSRIGGQSAPARDVEVVRTPSSPPKAAPKTIPQPAPRVAPPAVVAEKQPVPKAPERTQELAESLKPEPAPAPAPAVTNAPKPAPAPAPAVTNAPSIPAAPVLPSAGSNQRSQSFATGSGNSNAAGDGNNASGARQGSGSGSTVAAGPGTARQGTPQGQGRGEGDSQGRGSGRLACRECSKPKYPEKARRRGVEGAAKVKLEVDEKGNVTDAKIAKSSGNAELDEAAVRAARKWKLENSKGSSQGIVAKVDFALEGSQRSRRAEERQKRREARKKRRSQTENATRKPGSTGRDTKEAAAPKPQQPQSPKPPQQPASSNQNRLREALRRP